MVIGVGVDLCEIEKIAGVIERHGTRFLDRCFTTREQAHCGEGPGSTERYAARFAAKEAAMKAFGLGWTNGMRFIDIEVHHDEQGKPGLVFHNFAAEYAEKLEVANVQLSLSHEANVAAAFVILESAQECPQKLQQPDLESPGAS